MEYNATLKMMHILLSDTASSQVNGMRNDNRNN